MTLREYNKKRNFSSTNEPKGKKNPKKDKINKNSHKKPVLKRFVIQYHEARAKHYDFRLEYNGVLLSWAVPKGLSTSPKDKRLAVKVEDHPIDYINFEGIIPKGNYGAGTVEIYDSGEYLPISDFKKGLKEGNLKFYLKGEKLKGAWALVRAKDDNWLIIKKDDDFAKEEKKTSKKLPFKKCSPQLAKLSNSIPKGKEWLFEIKHDGYRVVSYVENGKVTMLSRNNLQYTNKFKNIVKILKQIDRYSFVVDGEVVVFDEKGKSDFSLLQDSIKHNKNNFCYVIFDLLALNGEDLRNLPLITRKNKLERLLANTDEILMFSQHIEKGKECFDFAKKNNLEGVVAKKKDSIYAGVRNDDWLKIKCRHRQEFIVAGFTTSNRNQLISSLILGYYDEKQRLIYVGKVGIGLTDNLKQTLYEKFSKISRKTCPFDEKLDINAKWLKCEIVVEVEYAELTRDKLLRQPSLIGIRKDKKAEDVHLEMVEE